MKDFEQRLKDRIEELPFTKGVDDGQYNEGIIDGFEDGARWAVAQISHDTNARKTKNPACI